MEKDIDKELDEIMNARKLRGEQQKVASAAAAQSEVVFRQSWQTCVNGVIKPVLKEMQARLEARQIGAKVQPCGTDGGYAIWIKPPDVDIRLHVRDRDEVTPEWPSLAITPELRRRRVRIFRSGAGAGGRTDVGDYDSIEVTPDVVKEKVVDFVRQLYSVE